MSTTHSAWTNKSVLAFAKGTDPIKEVEKRAREIVLYATEKGWSGPPFDPIRLADILRISVVPRDDIRDARTVPVGTRKAVIEFNPNRSRGRVRFSIAHEIAHTFFPDFAERIRHRDPHTRTAHDDWQLEMLCNIAASELIMPIGSFRELEEGDLSIDWVVDRRKEHDVSVEAVLIRIVKLTRNPCAMFCASRIEEGRAKDRYRLDYIIPSFTWPHSIPAGQRLPADSVVTQCTAIGYTAKGAEEWGLDGKRLSVQCVGIPPYPGSKYPRVAGLLVDSKIRNASTSQGIMYLRGNALEPRGDGHRAIAHIVNDRTPNWGGGGFAVALRKKWPQAQKEFRDWARRSDDHLRLGSVHVCDVSPDITVVSMVAQKGYGSAKPGIRYSALETCLEKLSTIANESASSIHMPRI